ncbi:MAG: helix-turn-helix domain-containing protein [Flavobacteriaceae bacterium]|jgi:transcriptional regulator with XRE-family HTH domain|nr:helix-turn-helix domain-containing protein [Flavobacteriaceae bacterium]
MSLGKKLIQLRHQKNWTQAQAAEHLNVTQSAYHLWEKGQSKPKTENLLRISEVYNVDFFSLLESPNDKNVINNPIMHDQSVSIQQQFYYPTIANVPQELVQSIINNQTEIAKLMEKQSKLIENLMKK